MTRGPVLRYAGHEYTLDAENVPDFADLFEMMAEKAIPFSWVSVPLVNGRRVEVLLSASIPLVIEYANPDGKPRASRGMVL